MKRLPALADAVYASQRLPRRLAVWPDVCHGASENGTKDRVFMDLLMINSPTLRFPPLLRSPSERCRQSHVVDL